MAANTWKAAAAQQVAAPDRAIEAFCEVCFVFDAFQFVLGLTASAARWVMRDRYAAQYVWED